MSIDEYQHDCFILNSLLAFHKINATFLTRYNVILSVRN